MSVFCQQKKKMKKFSPTNAYDVVPETYDDHIKMFMPDFLQCLSKFLTSDCTYSR